MEINLNSLRTLPFKTNLFFGSSGAGKTHFCCTFPRVAWLGALREDGFQTIAAMRPEDFYDPAHPPAVFGVTGIQDFVGHLFKDVFPGIQRGRFQTIVAELTFYADDVLAGIDAKDGRAKYGGLENHIIEIDKRLKAIPGARIVYNTLAMPPDDEKSPGGVLIPGRALSRKVPAMCSTVGYLRATDEKNQTVRYLHLAPYGGFMARHRHGARLPNFVCNPVFRDLEDLYYGRATVDGEGNIQRPEALRVVGGGALTKLPPLKR